MSSKATAWASQQDTKCPTLKCLLYTLAEHANHETWECFPKIETIARETCISKRTVQRRLQELVELGFVVIGTRQNNAGRQISSSYRLTGGYSVTIAPPGCQIVTPSQGEGVTGDMAAVSLVSPHDSLNLDSNQDSKSARPPSAEKQKKVPEYGETFERLWLAYEKYGHKKKAAEAFNKLEPEMQEQIIAAVPRYLASRGKDKTGRFVTYNLENFLRGEIYARHATPESVKRVEPVAPAADDRGKWGVYLSDWRRKDRWPAFLGPEPGFPGSLVPPDMLQHGEQEEADEHVLKILNWMPEHERRECQAGLRRIPSWLETRAKISAAARMGSTGSVDSGRPPCGLLPGLPAGGSGSAGEEIRTGE